MRWLTGKDRWVFLIVSALFVCGSYFWRLHVERGQVYVVYAFVFTCACALAQCDAALSDIAAGIVLGLAVSLRPTYAVAFIPLVLARKWRVALGGIGGALCGVAVPAVLFHPSIWHQYASAMAAQGRQYLHWMGPPPFPATSWYPRVIEGRSYWSTAGFPTIDASVAKIAHHAGLTFTPDALYAALVLTLVALMALLWLAGRGRRPRVAVLLLQGGVLAYVAEYFLVATRFSYRDVMLVPLLALVLVSLGTTYLRRSLWAAVMLVGLALGTVSVQWAPGGPNYAIFAGEVLVTLALLALTWIATRRQPMALSGEGADGGGAVARPDRQLPAGQEAQPG